MDNIAIREFRRRLGWTQWDLAERLGVDQGTVSRWERGVESPRPGSSAELRRLILQDDESRALKRYEARVRHSLQPAVLMDADARLRTVNTKVVQNYLERFNIDLSDSMGLSYARFAEMISAGQSWDAFQATGFLKGEFLLMRFYVNSRGTGHVTQYDPVFEDGQLAAISGMIVGTFDLPANDAFTVERIEAVPLDAPHSTVDLYRGPLADYTTFT